MLELAIICILQLVVMKRFKCIENSIRKEISITQEYDICLRNIYDN